MLCPNCKIQVKRNIRQRTQQKGYKVFFECPNCGKRLMKDTSRIAGLGALIVSINFVFIMMSIDWKIKFILAGILLVIMIPIVIKEENKIPWVEYNRDAFNKIRCSWCGVELLFDNTKKLGDFSGFNNYICNKCHRRYIREIQIGLGIILMLFLVVLYSAIRK